ncbi:hypothetical protein SCACP_32400 [Sporomusa carbonis]|uniref:LPS export ABC transporter periplasmic protein LptC n=1 Tax=Sporomusa carbonis TaxID=3076075 RepID=UPI003A74CECF
MNKKTYLSIGCVVFLLAGGLYYYLFRDEPPGNMSPSPEPTAAQSPANITFAGSSVIEEQDGKRLWELSADTIEADPNSKVVYLTNLKGVFYQKKGGKIDLIARQGVLDTKTGNISLQGDVKATASDGAEFTAPEARWAGETKTFTGAGGITMTRGDTVITGDKIETDANMEKVKVQGKAKVITGGTN